MSFSRSCFALPALAGVLVLGACTETQPKAEAPVPAPAPAPRVRTTADSLSDAKTVAFQCEKDQVFVVKVGSGKAWLMLPEGSVGLPQVESASGARYSNGRITFWNKGDEARIEMGGQTYEACTRNPEKTIWEDARLRGVNFRATGNEPGWLLEISNRDVLLVTDTGANRLQFPGMDILNEGDQITYMGSGAAGALRIRLRPGPCTDTMSGTVYETDVTVNLNDTELRGCGRTLKREP